MQENPIIIKKKKVQDIIPDVPNEDFRNNQEMKRALAEFLNEIIPDDNKPPAKIPTRSYESKPQIVEPYQSKSDVRILETLDSEKIFEKVEIHGDAFRGKKLTKEILRQEGLMPKHMVTIDDAVIWLSSSAYDLGSGRVAVMAYVKKDGKIVARSYYRSNSQGGIWRFIPNYIESNGHLQWYGKGWGEEGVTLPSVLQEALAKITSEDMPILNVKDPDFIFAGPARNYYGQVQSTYVEEIESEPINLKGTFKENHPPGGMSVGDKMNPREIKLSPEDSPDFSNLLASWTQNTDLYGKVTVEVFPSRDGRLRFMFCKTGDARAMVGGIENSSKMQSTGLRRSWVRGGDLATPIFEYSEQTGRYGNYARRSGNYVDMFENYISKIPVIREYLARNP